MGNVLQPRQFPFYNKLANKYDPGSKVSPENFGLPLAPPDPAVSPSAEDGLRFSRGESREIDVPLHQVRAVQTYVYDKHVQNLASVPQDEFHAIHSVPEAWEHRDGTYRLNEGHHRAAAAHLRGDETLRVRVNGRWERP